MPSYHNAKSVTIGSVSLTGVTGIQWSHDRPEISGSADGEVYAKVAGYGTAIVRGSITFLDPEQADAAENISGTLTATLQGIGSDADKTLTIVTVVTGGDSDNVSRDAVAACTVPFIVESADGTTDPVTIS